MPVITHAEMMDIVNKGLRKEFKSRLSLPPSPEDIELMKSIYGIDFLESLLIKKEKKNE